MMSNNELFYRRLKCELPILKQLNEQIVSQKEHGDHSLRELFKPKLRNVPPGKASLTGYNIVEDYYRTLQSFLMLLTQFFQDEISFTGELPSCITTSDFLSLPSICLRLWKRIKIIFKTEEHEKTDKAVDSKDTKESLITMSRISQTEYSCFAFCESCHVSTNLVKSLVHTILSEQRKYCVPKTVSSVYVLRERMKCEVFNLSQREVMRGWTIAIQEDIEKVAALIYNNHRHISALLQSKKIRKVNYKKTISTLTDDLALVRSQLSAEQAQIVYLQNQFDELKDSLSWRVKQTKEMNETINLYRKQIERLTDIVGCFKSCINNLQVTQSALKGYVKSTFSIFSRQITENTKNMTDLLAQVTNYINSSIDCETKKRIKAEQGLSDKKNTIDQIETKNLKLKQDINKLQENVTMFKDEIMLKDNEITRLTKNLEESNNYIKILKEKEAKRHLECNMNRSSQVAINFTGDPFTDMEKQRQRNKETIKALLRENSDIKETIHRMKRIESRYSSKASSLLSTSS